MNLAQNTFSLGLVFLQQNLKIKSAVILLCICIKLCTLITFCVKTKCKPDQTFTV